MFRTCRRLVLAAALVALPTVSSAAPITIDFESLSDSDAVVAQFAGLSFSNALVLTSGVSLNEFEFPPASGANVVSDDGGPVRIDFVSPVTSVGGYFTYNSALTFSVFDSGDNLLGSVSSAFGSNAAISGDLGSSPNEFLSLALANISYVTVTGAASGGSFTLDDLTYDRSVAVPEPATTGLILIGGLGLLRRRRRSCNRSIRCA